MSQPSYITFRKHTFLASAAMGLSAVVITLLVSLTVMALYALHVANHKSDQVISLAQSAVHGLPEFAKSLPPALSDMLDDRRDPQYRNELAISAKVVERPAPHGGLRTEIEIINNGDAVVSLLSLRVTVLDDREQLLCESQEWAATPMATDGSWRGPIMPGSKRRFSCRTGHPWGMHPTEGLNAQVEITELRVWNDTKSQDSPADTGTVEATASIIKPGPNG